MNGCIVERGQCGVVPEEISGHGSVKPWHESPPEHARRGSRNEMPLSRRSLGRHPVHFLGLGGGCEVLAVGDRVVLKEPRMAADLLRVWTVAECACEECASGMVAVSEFIAASRVHFARSELRRYGHPPAYELMAR